MTIRQVPAGEFKAKCLALLDEVARTGEILVITKRGKPVARILPPQSDGETRTWLKDSITHIGDIEGPCGGWEEWDPERGLRP